MAAKVAADVPLSQREKVLIDGGAPKTTSSHSAAKLLSLRISALGEWMRLTRSSQPIR
ncbi:hypothetical protein [Amycolatopsis sp. lyj-90]|uniref:hypothetical protein n=1 Tax=Amycolatopsis sp. lyj-90 TaxID=2789285 RepID=UPI00397A5CA8